MFPSVARVARGQLLQARHCLCRAAAQDRRVECRHILVETREAAQSAAVRLESGDDFAALAAEMSTCPSKSAGGRIGWVIRGMADSDIETAVLDKPIGTVTQVESASGFHLMEVIGESSPAAAAADGGAVQQPRIVNASVRDVAAVLQDGAALEEAQFIDVRELGEFEMARIEHFRLFPLSQAGEWIGTIAKELDPQKDTYVLCHHGVRSMQACQFLARQGFQNLFNVSGGIARYSVDVDPSVPQY